jgi:hypothetical protein
MKQVVTKEELKELISSGKLVKSFKKEDALDSGHWEYDFSNYLIKVDNHYVSADYLFWDDSGEFRESSMVKDKYASLPEIDFDENSGKWYIKFDSPDGGGYDVTSFEWYFDSEEDIINEMRRE